VNCVVEAWEKHEQELKGFLVNQLQDSQQADDLLQETFIKAIAEGSRFCELDNARAWLFRVTRNQLIDHYRRRKVTVEVPDHLPAIAPDDEPVANLAQCLPRAIGELSAADGEAIQLCDLDGMSQQDFADHLGISLPGAKSRLQRARRRLKQHLSEACQVRYDEAGNVCCFVPRDSPCG